MRNNITNVDSYKLSHYLQYPPKTEFISSYIEARGFDETQLPHPGEYGEVTVEVTLFGLQYFIKEYLMKPVTMQDIDEAQKRVKAHGLPFNKEGWEKIVTKHNGYLPLRISSVQEGASIPVGNVLVQVENTDPEFFWLVSYIETALLRAVWYGSSVATISRICKKIIKYVMEETCDDLSGLPFKLHDFGARGATSFEAACIGGAAHLVNFQGTDTFSALDLVSEYYNEPGVVGFSIPAAEHSTITSWGREGEVNAYANMINQFGDGMFAVVSDSYDIYKACADIWGDKLKGQLLSMNGTLVVRPDSGDPLEVLLKVLDILGEKFGTKRNSGGLKVLPNYIRVIQGDGINVKSLSKIVFACANKSWSIDNIAFGMGGGLLQGVNRDTFKFAMKQNAIKIAGQDWRDVQKDPITSSGKKSKAGRQALIMQDGTYQTIRVEDLNGRQNLLEVVYEDGRLLRDMTFEKVRENAAL